MANARIERAPPHEERSVLRQERVGCREAGPVRFGVVRECQHNPWAQGPSELFVFRCAIAILLTRNDPVDAIIAKSTEHQARFTSKRGDPHHFAHRGLASGT